MVDDVIFRSIRTFRETSMARPIHPSLSILVEDTSIFVLAPALVLHWVVSNQFQHTQTVEWCIDSGRRVDDEILPGYWIDKLLGAFVGS